ncbi:MAG: MAPEG family protein [Hyphomonadaceae bacterium]|nr:MAPEG family protein [Hyphomonadaceae bacterium]
MIELSDIQRQIVVAMLAQAALAGVLLLMMPAPRIAALRAGKVKRDDHGRPIFPKWTTQISDAFNNQFQVPTLFYMLCLLILWLHAESPLLAGMAWVFVALRWVHAAVFVTLNVVPIRFAVFLASGLVLLSMLVNVTRRVLGV